MTNYIIHHNLASCCSPRVGKSFKDLPGGGGWGNMLTKVDRYFAFEIFKTGTMLPIRYIFMSHSKKSANLDALGTHSKVFFNNRDLKFNFFFWKFTNFFLSLQGTIPKRKFEIKNLNFVVDPQIGKLVFDCRRKTKLVLTFSSFLTSNKPKEDILTGSGSCLKQLLNTFFSPPF